MEFYRPTFDKKPGLNGGAKVGTTEPGYFSGFVAFTGPQPGKICALGQKFSSCRSHFAPLPHDGMV
jgi:hypothetical protein